MRLLLLCLALSGCAACGHGSISADNANGSAAFLGCHWGAGSYQAFYEQDAP